MNTYDIHIYIYICIHICNKYVYTYDMYIYIYMICLYMFINPSVFHWPPLKVDHEWIQTEFEPVGGKDLLSVKAG